MANDHDPLSPLRSLFESEGDAAPDPLAPLRSLFETDVATRPDTAIPAVGGLDVVAGGPTSGEPDPYDPHGPYGAVGMDIPPDPTAEAAERFSRISEGLTRPSAGRTQPVARAFADGAALRGQRLLEGGAALIESAPDSPLTPPEATRLVGGGLRQVARVPGALSEATEEEREEHPGVAVAGEITTELGAYVVPGTAAIKGLRALSKAAPSVRAILGAEAAATMPVTASLAVDEETALTPALAELTETFRGSARRSPREPPSSCSSCRPPSRPPRRRPRDG